MYSPQPTLTATSKLKTNPNNPRAIRKDQLEKLVKSLREFPEMLEARPIVVNPDYVVLGGNMRLKAAVQAGLTEVPVYVASWDEAKNKEFIIKDNLAFGEWDWDMLANEWEPDELNDWGLEVPMLEDETEGLTDPDEVPEAPEETKTKLGDLWILGDHRLLCGDSTKAEHVKRLMAGQKADIMVTDPPYGVEYDPSWRAEVNEDGPNSKRAVGKVSNDDRADWTEAWQLFNGDVAYVWHADRYSPVVATSLEGTGLEVRYLIIWAKQRHTFGRGHYHHQHEPCWFVVRKGATASWAGDRKQTTLWEIDNNRHNETGHGTQKPVECMARAIRNHDSQLVYDPFLGSGTTIIASEQLGRQCYGMELDPKYCDVIVKRWEDFTGKKAQLDKEEQEFEIITQAT